MPGLPRASRKVLEGPEYLCAPAPVPAHPLHLCPLPCVLHAAITAAPHRFPCRVCASLPTCSLCLKPRERGLSTEPGRQEKKGWFRRNGSAQLWRSRPTSGVSFVGVNCTETSGEFQALLSTFISCSQLRKQVNFPL